jgi:uncharacterized protein
VNTSGWLFSRASQQFSGTLTVTNTGGSTITTPMLVLLNGLPAGVTLANAGGIFSGAPYIAVQGPGSVAAGASATVSLQFSNPAKGPIVFSPVIYTS